MAAFNSTFQTDLAKPSRVVPIPDTYTRGDNESHTITVLVYDSENPDCGLMAGSVSAAVARQDGNTIPLTTGTKGAATVPVKLADGSTAQATPCTITLKQACFDCPGQVVVVIRLVSGETITSVFVGSGKVNAGLTNSIIDPGDVITDITALIAAAEQAAEDAQAALTQATAVVSYAEQTGKTDAQKAQARENIGAISDSDLDDLRMTDLQLGGAISDVGHSLAADYNWQTGTYAVGDYVMYGDKLYRCATAIATPETWTPAHWTEVKLSGEVTDLKGAVETMEPVVEKSPIVLNTDAEDADIDVTDEEGNVILRLAGGHIETKEFDSRDMAVKVNISQGAVNAGKALMVDQSGNLAPQTLPPTVEIDDTLTQEGEAADAKVTGDAVADLNLGLSRTAKSMQTTESGVDLDVTDPNGNVILRLADGHIQTKNFDSQNTTQDAVKSVNNVLPDVNGNVDVTAQIDPSDLQAAVDTYLDDHPVVAAAAGIVSVADYGAVGDGQTDDSAAIQNAVNSNYDVYFESNKTYYVASPITINHDCKLHGGLNTVIKTKTPSGGVVNDCFVVEGTLKATTTITTDYSPTGSTDNSGNQFTLADMSSVNVGDVMVITATDQYYSYARQYYYLGGTFLITDTYNGHIYTNMGLPFGITKTSNVSAKVYSAPSVIFENLHFVSDLDSLYQYKYLITLDKCKNSIIRNCDMNEFSNGILIYNCVNTLVDGISMSKSKYDSTAGGDAYGICISSSTHTEITRVLMLCSGSAVDLGGTIPAFDTFITKCDLASEARPGGIGMHENSYNIVIEDCVLTGAMLYGTAIVNRCRFIKSNRVDNSTALTIRGSHDERWARFKITDCEFEGLLNYVRKPMPQTPIQSFDCVIGDIEFIGCNGGSILVNDTVSSNIPSITLNKLIVRDCHDIVYIWHTSDTTIKYLGIVDTTFTSWAWLTAGSGFSASNIEKVLVESKNPRVSRMLVDLKKNGGKYILPAGIKISCSSSDTGAHYVVCGKNAASNDPGDYSIGNVSGSVGNALTRTVNTGFATSLSVNQSGNLVFTQPSNTTTAYIYPTCLMYVDETSVINMSCVIKNTGNTTGSVFYPYIATVDCDTGKLTYIGGGSSGTASADGTEISHTRRVEGNSLVMCYLYSSNPVADSETTISEFLAVEDHVGFGSSDYVAYNGDSCDGDGVLTSVNGVNHVMATPDSFNITFNVDYLEV